MIRSTYIIESKERWSTASNGYMPAEGWLVRVEERADCGRYFEVKATLLWEQRGTIRRHIEGVRVPSDGPRTHQSLSRARDDARRLAAVLSGSIEPSWTRTDYSREGISTTVETL